MTEREALKIALKTLKKIQEGCGNVIEDELHAEAVSLAKMVRKDCKQSIVAIEEVLAQPDQEPVAWMDEYGDVLSASVVDGKGLRNIPLYTAPPPRQWVGLTEEEYKNIRYGSDESGELYVSYTSYDEGDGYEEIEIYVDDFAKAIEAKLREKNGC